MTNTERQNKLREIVIVKLNKKAEDHLVDLLDWYITAVEYEVEMRFMFHASSKSSDFEELARKIDVAVDDKHQSRRALCDFIEALEIVELIDENEAHEMREISRKLRREFKEAEENYWNEVAPKLGLI